MIDSSECSKRCKGWTSSHAHTAVTCDNVASTVETDRTAVSMEEALWWQQAMLILLVATWGYDGYKTAYLVS